QSLVTSPSHPCAAVATAEGLTTGVVQQVPAVAVAAQGSGGVLTSPQSPQLVDPLQLPDVRAAMVELRIKYEVEKARRETLEAVLNGRLAQVGEQSLSKMGSLSGFSLSHSSMNTHNRVEATQATGVAAHVLGQGGPGGQGPNREKPINQLVHLTESGPLSPQCPEQPVMKNHAPRYRTRLSSHRSQDSQLSSVALGKASLSSASSARKYKMKKPEVFSGASTSEEFERFIRLFQLHLKSRGCEDPAEWVDILEGFLADTPALVYTQLRRDKPSLSYEEVVKELRVCFGRPLDARLARHQIHDLTWTPGESLAHLVARIRELHFRAHSETPPFEEREVYAGDTFYRLLPQEWKLRIRDKNLSSLSEYLGAAME
ncbi:MAG: hypothetical protein GY934_04635, partial [Gammaproteobacteria bacterium]|nr:hypothetical protein [Gammaproteobacteria bacterium]